MADITTQFPTTPAYSAVTLNTVTPMITSETNSGKVRRAGFGHSYYTFEIQYPTLTYAESQSVKGYLGQLAGQLYSFEIVLPRLSQSQASNVSANISLTANCNAAARSCTISGAGNAQNVLKAGDYFKFNTHSKVYQCVTDVTSNAAGYANVVFSGGAVTTVTAGSYITRTDVPFTVILDEASTSAEHGPGGLTSVSLKMREVW